MNIALQITCPLFEVGSTLVTYVLKVLAIYLLVPESVCIAYRKINSADDAQQAPASHSFSYQMRENALASSAFISH
jgi:hypothetical protein